MLHDISPDRYKWCAHVSVMYTHILVYIFTINILEAFLSITSACFHVDSPFKLQHELRYLCSSSDFWISFSFSTHHFLFLFNPFIFIYTYILPFVLNELFFFISSFVWNRSWSFKLFSVLFRSNVCCAGDTDFWQWSIQRQWDVGLKSQHITWPFKLFYWFHIK